MVPDVLNHFSENNVKNKITQNNIINVNIPEPESYLVSDLKNKQTNKKINIKIVKGLRWRGAVIIDFYITIKK